MFEFENLIPKPYRRDKPAQRFQHNGFEKGLTEEQSFSG